LAFFQRDAKIAEYHTPPTRNAEAAAARMAHQFRV
jgi:hypothetical protein